MVLFCYQKRTYIFVEIVIEGNNNGVDTSEFEEKIDKLIYKLCDFSDSEIGIIENWN